MFDPGSSSSPVECVSPAESDEPTTHRKIDPNLRAILVVLTLGIVAVVALAGLDAWASHELKDWPAISHAAEGAIATIGVLFAAAMTTAAVALHRRRRR